MTKESLKMYSYVVVVVDEDGEKKIHHSACFAGSEDEALGIAIRETKSQFKNWDIRSYSVINLGSLGTSE